MGLFRKSKREQYATGFSWGRREHKFEERTTKWLVTGILLLCGGVYLEFWMHWAYGVYLLYLAIFVFVMSWIFRLISAYSHKREKAYMDRLRFHQFKKGK